MRFKLFHMSVFIHPSFWIFLLIFAIQPKLEMWQMAILGAVWVFSVLFHEYGHAFAAQKVGRIPEITLENCGGYVSYDGRALSDKQHFFVTLCGPLFTALLIGLSYALLKNGAFGLFSARYLLYLTFRLNIYWLIVNLAPLQPLDGGKIAQYGLQKLFGVERGYRWGLFLGNATALLGIGYFFWTNSFFFVYLFAFYGWKNFQALLAAPKKQTHSPFGQYQQALDALDQEDTQKAKLLLEKLIRSKDEYLKIRASESLADLLDQQGNKKSAYALLSKLDFAKLTRGKWLFSKLAYEEGNYEPIRSFAGEIYQVHPAFETAFLNAKAFAKLGASGYAIGWLETALQFEEVKNKPIDKLFADPAFESLQQDPAFKELQGRFESVALA